MQPIVADNHRAAGLRFGDRRVLALMHTLCLFAVLPTGFRHRDVRAHVAQLLGRDAATYGSGPLTYDLRRLRLHRLIERAPHSHRYRTTELGARTAMLYVRLYTRALRPARVTAARRFHAWPTGIDRCDVALADFLHEVRLAA
jgi:hypothetical protein